MFHESSAKTVLSPLEIDDYCAQIFLELDETSSKPSNCVNYFLGGISLDFHFLDARSLKLFSPSLVHLVRDQAFPPDWMLYILNAKYTGPLLPKMLGNIHLYRGVFEYESSDRYCFQYLEHLNTLLILDYHKKRGIWWTSTAVETSEHENVFPVRYIMHAILRPMGGLILHGAVVGRNSRGVLIVGKSGMGKSTTSLACLISGMDFVCDDHCLYYNGTTYSLSQFAKLSKNSLNLLPQLQKKDLYVDETPDWKTILSLFPFFKAQLVNSLKVKAILLPVLSEERQPSLVPCSSSDALKAVAPSSFSQVFENHEREMSIMAELVRQFPAYKLNLSSEMSSVVNLVEEILAT